MPDHKQQHYVPRCYLKPFSLNADGAAINLYNSSGRRVVCNAPVKGQCAKNYFHGEDLRLEMALWPFENEYARVIRTLQSEEEELTEQDIAVLQGFAHLQYIRTDMAIKRARLAHEGMLHAVYDGRPTNPPNIDLSDRALVQELIGMYVETWQITTDLKACIIKNETNSDFITSVDPSVFVNKFYAQRLGQQNFGLVSSGVLFFLPLTPRYQICCYDGGVYTVPGKNGPFVSINKIADVNALNELQYLKAANNIYFASWDDRGRVESEFESFKPDRPPTWYDFSMFVPETQSEQNVIYRRATDEERTTARETMVAMSVRHPVPSRWVSKVQYRTLPRVYYEGTGAGHVRKEEWLRSRP